MQYVLKVGSYYAADPHAFVNDQEEGFRDAELRNLVEDLPQLRSVSTTLITFSREQLMLEGGTEPVLRPIKAWLASAERRTMGMSFPQSAR